VQPGVWERLTRSSLFLDQTETRLEVDRTQVEEFYHPLAIDLVARCSAIPRLMVAVAGPPGSGKTAFATLLVAVVNAEAEREVAALVGLDGWHYANAYLETHFIERGGQRIALREIKGAPETFDAAAAYDCLALMRQGGRVSYPVYSRRLHEPVPGGGAVRSSHKVVVVEGNYVLLGEEPWWRFQGLFDVGIFISAPRETLMASLTERHRRGGKTPEVTARHIRAVDLPNAVRVASSVDQAQVVVYKADVQTIDRVEWRVTP
jgi:pantothenate kinase